jgi:hypothetical protein
MKNVVEGYNLREFMMTVIIMPKQHLYNVLCGMLWHGDFTLVLMRPWFV